MNDGTDENDQTGEGRKRRRSEEDDATEMQAQEPPKKQRRQRRSQTIAPADPAQLPVPWSFDIEKRRRIRKENAMRVLSQDMPQMISRLNDIFRRSKAASDEKRLINIAEGQGSTVKPGPCAAPKQRKLNRDVKQLLDGANEFLQEQNQPLEEGESEGESEETPSDEQIQSLQALSRKLALLSEQFRQIHQTMDGTEKLHLKADLEQVRLIVEHPTFCELQEQVDAPVDPQAPLRETSELIELVEAEMNKAIDLSRDIGLWIDLHESPMPLATDLETDVRKVVHEVINGMVKFCDANRANRQQYITTRIPLVLKTVQEPLSIDRLMALDSFDSVMAITWRQNAASLADLCVHLIHFVNSHFHILGQPVPTEDPSALNHLYS